MIEVMRHVASGNVKITPEVLVANDGAAGEGAPSAALGLVPAFVAKLLINEPRATKSGT